MTEATPRPWKAVNRGTQKEPMMSVMAERIAGRGFRHEVAICATGDSHQSMENANAALIVEAVNAYDDLKAENARLRAALDEAVTLAKLAQSVGAMLTEPDAISKTSSAHAYAHCVELERSARAFIDKHGERK